MGKYDGVLICSDLDGTICNSKGEISKENTDAIDYFIKNGGKFSLSTGRSPQYVKALEEKGIYCNAPIIALNGAMIYDIQNEKMLYHNPMDFEKISSIKEFVEENRIHFKEVCFHSKDTVNNYADIEERILYKVVFACNTCESAKILRKNLENKYNDGFCILNSWVTGVEILEEKSTKGECINKIREISGASVDKIVCVGDYENDISMLLCADISYAVANAIPEAKVAATRLTVSNNEHALRAIINEL